MKFAVFFVFAAFAFLAQANAKSIDSFSVQRGALADAMKTKLQQSKEKLNKFLDTASEKLKHTIVEIQKKTDELIDQLTQKAHAATESVYVAAQKVIAKVEKLEDKYFPNSKTEATEEKHESTEVKAIEDVPTESETVEEKAQPTVESQ